jgi:hypothetical protein
MHWCDTKRIQPQETTAATAAQSAAFAVFSEQQTPEFDEAQFSTP